MRSSSVTQAKREYCGRPETSAKESCCGRIPSVTPLPPWLPPPTANSFRSYYLSGFLTLQTTLDRFMFNRALPAAAASSEEQERSEDRPEDQSDGFTCVPPEVVGVPFPTAAYDQNLFYKAVGYLLGLAMTMVSRPVVSQQSLF